MATDYWNWKTIHSGPQTKERPAHLCSLEIDPRDPSAIIQALTDERDRWRERYGDSEDQIVTLKARIAELEAENKSMAHVIEAVEKEAITSDRVDCALQAHRSTYRR